MRFDKIVQAVGPLVMLAAMGGIAANKRGCNVNFKGKGFRFEGKEPKPLADLDMGGDAPRKVVLLGPDQVVITEGEDFTISVQGDEEAKAGIRFVLEDGTLAVMRDDPCNYAGDGATISVIMPPPEKITIAGSGQLTTAVLAPEAEATIAGSGNLATGNIAIDKLDVTIAGSGTLAAGGSVGELSLTVAGSGNADMPDLLVGTADIDIAGSGNSIFGCDGEVHASIMGSGNVTVRGSARCSVSSMGSGTLVCEPREKAA